MTPFSPINLADHAAAMCGMQPAASPLIEAGRNHAAALDAGDPDTAAETGRKLISEVAVLVDAMRTNLTAAEHVLCELVTVLDNVEESTHD